MPKTMLAKKKSPRQHLDTLKQPDQMALPVSKLLAVLTTAFKHGMILGTSIVLTTNSDNTAVISHDPQPNHRTPKS
jgi:hypothetical protein